MGEFRPRSIGARGVWAVTSQTWARACELLRAEGAGFGTLVGGQPISCEDPRRVATGEGPVVFDVTACGVTGSEALRHGAAITFARYGGWVLAASARGLEHAVERFLWEGRDEAIAESLLATEGRSHVAWSRASDVAQVVASYLACHPLVAGIRYPGLADDPSRQVAADILLDGFGPWVDWQDCVGEWHRVACSAEDDARGRILLLERKLYDC